MDTILLNDYDLNAVKIACKQLNSGGIGIFPTDTVYGIGCNALNEKAITSLYDIKSRSFHKPINVLVSNIDMVKSIVSNISDLEYQLMDSFWPGPLSIIFKKNDCISSVLTAGLDTVGIRMPKNEFCLHLIHMIGKPLATTSANISNKTPFTKIDHELIDTFHSKVDFIVDGGLLQIGIPSTIVTVENNRIIILRDGPITKNDIITAIGGDIDVQ